MDLVTRSSLATREAAAAAEHAAAVQALTEREMEAMRLFALGATWKQVAKAAGIKTDSGARKFVARALTKYARVVDTTPISEARALMLARLNEVLGGNMIAAVQGDDKAAKTVLNAMQQQARLLGLDAPRRHEHEHHVTADGPAERQAREQAVHKKLTDFHNRTIEGETV